ncbi:hypothetical protein chiPu_0033194, partial [Chiloscyllium punctatum]|nr:hypothetical protein [Chiloscyllium punctatum]
ALVDLVHGLADQAEFDHRAVARDEARVRGAARGRELRPAAGGLLDRGNREVGERSGLGDEHVRVRRLPVDMRADAVAAGLRQPFVDQLPEALLRMVVVVADVELGARLAGDHVARGVADVDGGEFEVAGLELRAAVIERLVAQRHDQPGDVGHRVRGAVRIGDVALHAVDHQRAGLRAAP